MVGDAYDLLGVYTSADLLRGDLGAIRFAGPVQSASHTASPPIETPGRGHAGMAPAPASARPSPWPAECPGHLELPPQGGSTSRASPHEGYEEADEGEQDWGGDPELDLLGFPDEP